MADRTLLHYSPRPLTRINSTPSQTRAMARSAMKPDGLWVSVEGEADWKSWTEGENFRLETLAVVHEIKLCPNARILWIADEEAFDAFNANYGFSPLPEISMQAIRWDFVAVDYQGIVIAPYLHNRRFGPLWYYGWDCASGCIWDAAAIESFTVRQEVAP